MSHLVTDKTKLLARVRRLKGQIEAVERAVEAEADCGAILHLVASIKGAMSGLTTELIEDHLMHHVCNEADADVRKAGADELTRILRSYLK